MQYNADVSVQSKEGDTPLHMAALRNRVQLVPVLLAAGSDVEARDLNGRTAFHHAVQGRNLEIVVALLHAGSNLRAVDKYGRNVFHVAALSRSFVTRMVKSETLLAIFSTLVQHGGDLNGFDRFYMTALHLAVAVNNVRVFRTLHHLRATLCEEGPHGCTLLHYAAYSASPTCWLRCWRQKSARSILTS